jgi:hypothetical protein
MARMSEGLLVENFGSDFLWAQEHTVPTRGDEKFRNSSSSHFPCRKAKVES